MCQVKAFISDGPEVRKGPQRCRVQQAGRCRPREKQEGLQHGRTLRQRDYELGQERSHRPYRLRNNLKKPPDSNNTMVARLSEL